MKVASLLPEDEKLKIELYGELATLQRQGTEPKNAPPGKCQGGTNNNGCGGKIYSRPYG